VTDVRVLLMTAPSAQVAEEIVNTLVNERLIACGNITAPVTSIYRWQGAVERADEVLVIIKTVESAVTDVTRRIGELHPYEVPEVLSLHVSTGNQAYLSWVDESVE
jgi:periplasmic divalent cation tolerance protein